MKRNLKKQSGENKVKKPICVLTLPLLVHQNEADRLGKMFECGRFMYNMLVASGLKRLREMERQKAWRKNQKHLAHVYEELKPLEAKIESVSKKLKNLSEKSKLTESEEIEKKNLKEKKYEIAEEITTLKAESKPLYNIRDEYRKKYELYNSSRFYADSQRFIGNNGHLLPSQTVQIIVEQVWDAFDKHFSGNGRKIHFKEFGELNTLQGKTNLTGICFNVATGIVHIGYKKADENAPYSAGIDVSAICAKPPKPGKIPSSSYIYEQEMLRKPIRYCAIKQGSTKNGFRYFLVLFLEGVAPPKIVPETGDLKYPLGHGNVGVDIGVSTVALCGENNVALEPLAKKSGELEKEIEKLQESVSRKRTINNKAFFDEKGNIIRLPELRKNHPELLNNRGTRKWNISNNEKKIRKRIRYLQYLKSLYRELWHNRITNLILAYGDRFFVETMNFRALAKKVKEAKKKANGRYASRKRYGKSVLRNAPAAFINTLKRKAEAQSGALCKINTKMLMASQYNHMTDEYVKKKLNQRWNYMPNGDIIQRDLYSAFLIRHVNPDSSTFNKSKIKETYPTFVRLHNKEIARLRTLKNLPKCIGL